MAPHPALSPRCGTGNVKGTGRGIQGTAIELGGVASWGLLPLPARNEWGEGWGERNPNKNGPSKSVSGLKARRQWTLLRLGRGVCFSLALAMSIHGIPTGAQPNPPPTRSARNRAAAVASRELARQLADSFDAGDVYISASGPRKLRRLAGVVLVK